MEKYSVEKFGTLVSVFHYKFYPFQPKILPGIFQILLNPQCRLNAILVHSASGNELQLVTSIEPRVGVKLGGGSGGRGVTPKL